MPKPVRGPSGSSRSRSLVSDGPGDGVASRLKFEVGKQVVQWTIGLVLPVAGVIWAAFTFYFVPKMAGQIVAMITTPENFPGGKNPLDDYIADKSLGKTRTVRLGADSVSFQSVYFETRENKKKKFSESSTQNKPSELVRFEGLIREGQNIEIMGIGLKLNFYREDEDEEKDITEVAEGFNLIITCNDFVLDEKTAKREMVIRNIKEEARLENIVLTKSLNWKERSPSVPKKLNISIKPEITGNTGNFSLRGHFVMLIYNPSILEMKEQEAH